MLPSPRTRVGKKPGFFRKTQPRWVFKKKKKKRVFWGKIRVLWGKCGFFYNSLVSYMSISLLILYLYYLNLVIFLCPQFHLYFSYLLIILENLREKYKNKFNRHASLLLGKKSFPKTDFKSSLYQYCSPVF